MKKFEDPKILFAAIRKRDNNALKFLYDNVYQKVKYYVVSNSGIESDAKDVFQKAVIAFYEKVIKNSSFSVANPAGYLYKIAFNMWLKVIEKKKKLPVTSNEFPEIEDIKLESNDEEINKLRKLLAEMGDKCREIIKLFYYGEYKMKEIAEMLGYAANSMKVVKSRCLADLRESASNNNK